MNSRADRTTMEPGTQCHLSGIKEWNTSLFLCKSFHSSVIVKHSHGEHNHLLLNTGIFCVIIFTGYKIPDQYRWVQIRMCYYSGKMHFILKCLNIASEIQMGVIWSVGLICKCKPFKRCPHTFPRETRALICKCRGMSIYIHEKRQAFICKPYKLNGILTFSVPRTEAAIRTREVNATRGNCIVIIRT